MSTIFSSFLRKVSVSSPTLSFRGMSLVSNKLAGKVAIITASTAGIGYEIAKGLATNGAKVVISSRKEHHVEETVSKLCNLGLDATGVVCHVGKENDRTNLIQKAIDTHGKLDIVVLNAGINPYFGSLLETPESSWDRIFDINVKSGFLLAKEVMPHLRKTKGNMLFVSSITGYVPAPMIGAYSVSKTALLGLVKALSVECAESDVRVNCIAPGIIETSFSSALTQSTIGDNLKKSTPLRRFGDPAECAGAAVFLCSDDASYVTGETLMVTGGMPARL